MSIKLPVEQALWTREQVEQWLASRKLSDLVSLEKAEEFAKDAGWTRPGTPPTAVKIPAAMLPTLGTLTDPNSWRTDMASVYLDQQQANAYATNGSVAMRVRVKASDATKKDMAPERVDAVLPPRGDRKLVSLTAWNLMRLCLSAIAAGNPSQPEDCRIDFYLAAEGTGAVRYEIVHCKDNTVQAVGAIMPLTVNKQPEDPAGIV